MEHMETAISDDFIIIIKQSIYRATQSKEQPRTYILLLYEPNKNYFTELTGQSKT